MALSSPQTSATKLTFKEAISFLASPDTGKTLVLGDQANLTTQDKSETFPLLGELPQLFPAKYQPYLGKDTLEFPLQPYNDSILQYGLLTSIKHREGFPNSPHDSPWYLKHVEQVRHLVRKAKGTVFDIGCDVPDIGASMFPDGTSYLGLDPLYYDKSHFRLLGMAEYLPVLSGSFDNACLLSSLDHILDHHRAIDEAWRILKPGGMLYFQILVWTHRAELAPDHLHFHHFREYEILGALEKFRIMELIRTPWKDDDHRTSLYIAARKV